VRAPRHGLLVFSLLGCIRPSQPDPRRPAPAAQTAAPQPTPPVAPPAPPPTAPSPELALRFVTRVPSGADDTTRLPLVVALHGLGDTPEAFVELVSSMGLRLRVAAPAGLDRWGDGYAWFGLRTELLQAQWVAGMRRAAEVVTPEIARFATSHPTCGLPVVLGFSQGAMLSYAVLARPGAGVFAALPVAGLLPRELWPVARVVGGLLPSVTAFHGEADPRVSLADDRATLEAFRAVGFRADLRTYPGVGHAIPPAVVGDLRAKLVELMRSQGCPVE
jgi:phospholipase/carboxylesterase